MTDLYRTFNIDTRRLTRAKKAYAGQVGDEKATVLYFDIVDEDGDEFDISEFTPYIVFQVHDQDGHPFIYGPNSKPSFGIDYIDDNDDRRWYYFPIPWDVSARSKGVLRYQIYLLKSTMERDPETGALITTDALNIMSEVDEVLIRRSITSVPSMAPSETEPTVLAIYTFLTENAFVDVERNIGEGEVTLNFQTMGPRKVAIDVPTTTARKYQITGQEGVRTYNITHGLNNMPYSLEVYRTDTGVYERVYVKTYITTTQIILMFHTAPVGQEFEVVCTYMNEELSQ